MTATLQEPQLTPSSDGPAVLVASDYAQGSRARRGERLDHVFEERCDWMSTYGRADHLAVDAGDIRLTFGQLDERANQLARQLLARGARPGDRIALLFDQAVHSYVAMLAVLKINAAYVPLDVGFPADRIAYIISDAGVRLVLSLSHVKDRVEGLEEFAPGLLYVDKAADAIARQNPARLTDAERGVPAEDLAYLIYTSGTTGKPKGVAIEHTSICNFVRVAAEVYGVRMHDRVYQGMTIAFDFSVEEIWVPWVAGATLIPKPAGSSLLGLDLHAFLAERKVTAMCCVPTLLATIEEDLPDLRFLLVSGEACPQDLIARWYKPGRRFLNVYGPTEATVTATWTVLHPDRPVTIGQPLPTYTTVILDRDNPFHALPHGEIGEIGIAGIGLATGYLNRDDLTDKAFIPDFLGIAGNPSGRIYRTGDLGRVNSDGEIEYMGRIDLQVKIRGYRIELTEIESVLLQVPGISAAVVDTFEPTEGQKELVGYYSLRTGVDALDQDVILAHLREQLPPYMVPAYLEHLAAIPMTPQDKADRRALPKPTARRSSGPAGEYVAAGSTTESILAAALATTLGLDKVSVDSHFFDDLGANSLLMAKFSALVRKESALPSLSMREVYQNPTVRKLAAAMGDAAPGASAPAPTGTVVRGSSAGYLLFGAAQLLIMLASVVLGALVLQTGVVFAFEGTNLVPGNGFLQATDTPSIMGRAALFGLAATLVGCLAPIAVKWLLVGRWKPRQIRLWSAGHLRFWLAQSLIRLNPLVLFAGSPLYNMYLRALGARIGRGVTILSASVPVATDLITIGAGTIIRRDCSFTGYRAVAGAIQTGRVDIGRDVFIGEMTVLDVDTVIGDGAQLGHTSSVHAGQRIPAGESWHGVPAEPTTVNYRVVAPAAGAEIRRFLYSAGQLLLAMAVAPIVAATSVGLIAIVPGTTAVVGSTNDLVLMPKFYLLVTAGTFAMFVFGVLGALATMIIGPRLLSVFIRPGRSYPLYGIRWIIAQAIMAMSNSAFFIRLFGDASASVGYLQGLGYSMPDLEQTGSNFGTELRQDSALLTTVGTGTMISDGLKIMNADFSATSFRISRVAIGANNFIGNNIVFPADAKVGQNVLLGTKVMVPMDGEVRENVGLLGSPCFEIPRSTTSESDIDDVRDNPAEFRSRLRRKFWHNTRTMLVFLAVRWIQVLVTALAFAVAVDLYYRFGAIGIAVAAVASGLFSIVFTALVDRAVLGFRSLVPRLVSIYDPYFWKHERVWKLGATVALAGTPFRNVIHRMLGVRVGRRVFDDGCYIPERSLVSIGDDAVLNAASVIQCHSLEDGTFKSDRTEIGAGTVIGVAAFVHYGVTMGDGAVLDADSFLMKGETIAPFAVWQGNPATEVRIVAAPVEPARPAPTPMVPAPLAPARAAAPAAAVRPTQIDYEARATAPALLGFAAPVAPARPAPVQAARVAPVARVAPASRPVPAQRPAPAQRPVSTQRPAPAQRPAARPAQAAAQPVVTASYTFDTRQAPAAPAGAPAPYSFLEDAVTTALPVVAPVVRPTPAAGAAPVDARLAPAGRLAPIPSPVPAPTAAARPAPPVRPVPAPRSAAAATPVPAASPAPAATSAPATPAPAARPTPSPRPHPRPAIAAVPALAADVPAVRSSGSPERSSVRPRVTTPLPGPRSAEFLARQDNTGTSARRFPFAVADASGSHIRDLDGNVFIDFLAGAGVMALGSTRTENVQRDDVLGNVQARGEQIAARLSGLASHPGVFEVRGMGLMWGIELVAPGDGRSVTELARDVQARALRSGLIVELGGRDDRMVRMMPALDVTAEVVDIAISILLLAIEGAYVGASQAA